MIANLEKVNKNEKEKGEDACVCLKKYMYVFVGLAVICLYSDIYAAVVMSEKHFAEYTELLC